MGKTVVPRKETPAAKEEIPIAMMEEETVEETQAEEAEESDPEIEALIAARTKAKKEKNFAEADMIRDELRFRHIEIIDTPQGTKWRRV